MERLDARGETPLIYAVSVLLTIGIFTVDLLTPLGYGDWLSYFLPLLVISRAPRIRDVYVFTAALTVLLALGYLYGPPGVRRDVALLNRLFVAAVFWVTAVILAQRRRAHEALRAARENLEERVRERTAALVEEVAERKRAEEALNRSREELEMRIRERTRDLTLLNEELRTEIRQRVQAENELFETGHALRGVIDASPLAIVALDAQGKVTLWNPAAERMFGWAEAEVKGRLYPLVPEERKEEFLDLLCHSFGGEPVTSLETKRRRKDGTLLDVLISTAPLRDASGGVRGSIGLMADLTAWKEAQEAVRAERAFREAVEDSLPIGLGAIDLAGRIIHVNDAVCAMTGYSREELLGTGPPHHVWPPEEREKIAAVLTGVLAGKVPKRVDLRLMKRGGQRFDARIRPSPLKDARGSLQGYVASIEDITQIKEMERMALVQQKMASLGHLAAGIAHEIRNPLSGLNLHLSALGQLLAEAESLERETLESTEAIIGMAKTASGKIEAVVRKVLDFARPTLPRMTPLSVNDCVREAVELAQVALRRSGIRLDVSLQEDLPPCRGDARLLEQALLNLLTNAAQVMEGQAGERVIEISTSRACSCPGNGDHVTVSVADSGPGVPLPLREKIFDPFFTTKKEGTGIGLALTHRIVADHGGFLAVGTSRFGGALFTIGIPAGGSADMMAHI